MEYQKNGLKSSRLGLGCGRMSTTDRNESINTIRTAIESGITHINTGDFYSIGHNEMLIGESIKGFDRDKIFLSVKFGVLTEPNGRMYGLDVRPQNVKNYLAYSLKRLNVEYIDLYQPARIDADIPVEEIIGAVSDMVKAGYVKHIGITQIDAKTLRRAHAVHPISLLESQYSLLNREIEHELLPAARELGIGVVAFGALAHGLLSGGYSKDTISGYNSMIPLYFKENIDKNLSLVEAFCKIAEEKQVTAAQLAFAWILSKGDDIVPLIGSTRTATLENSLKALNISLSTEDLEKIEKAIPENEIAGAGFIKMNLKNGKVVR